MEMLCMIGIFAVAVAICLQCFAMANDISKKRSELDSAVLIAQDTCEMLKHAHGDMDYVVELTGGKVTDDGLIIHRSGNTDGSGQRQNDFTVTVSNHICYGGLGQAKVSVSTDERTVYELTVAWQE